MSRTSTVLTVASVTLLGGLLAYAVYFDYKRRNDQEFRKRLRSDKKKIQKTVAEEQARQPELQFPNGKTHEDLHAAVKRAREQRPPAHPQELQTFFEMSMAEAEALIGQGPGYFFDAAVAFYHCLRVYPNGPELLNLFQQSLPQPVMMTVGELLNIEVKMRLQSYYEHLPPKRMNVRIERRNIPDGDGSLTLRDVLVATKDFKAGDEIYTEHPVVAVLDSDIQEQGSHCSYCLREMHNGVAIKMNGDLTNSVYCSKKCQMQAKAQYQNFLFGIENPVHVESILTDEADRRVAQKAFADYLKNSHQIVGLLVARLVALHVTCETSKFSPPNDPIRSHIPELAMSSQYGLYDHLERMRYVSTSDPEEWKLFNNLLAKTLPGLEASHPNEYHTAFRSKAAYNMIGVCYGGGRDDRPSFADRPELIERSRTPYGTSKQIGAGLYIVSSYLLHSCAPSVRPSFSSGTSELHLIATRDISQDELLSMAYVNVTRGVEESPEECRRRRRYELARGWKFACRCNRCMENSEPEEIPGISGDHSTVEAVYDMLSRNEASNANDVE